jgi:hypothetical protein
MQTILYKSSIATERLSAWEKVFEKILRPWTLGPIIIEKGKDQVFDHSTKITT